MSSDETTAATPEGENSTRYTTRSPWSGRRRNQGVIDLRDTGNTNKMTVVKDQTRRREMLTSNPAGVAPPPIVDTKKPVSQLDHHPITNMHDVEKRHIPPRDTTDISSNPVPRKSWRK